MSSALGHRTNIVGQKLPPLRDQLAGFAKPALLMVFVIIELLRTLLRAPLAPFQDLTKFRHHAFSDFWLKWGESMSQNLSPTTVESLKSAHGVVLDIGPGNGSVMHYFDASKITKAYGPEPAVDMHPALAKKIQAAGLDGKYHPLVCGAEPESLIPALAKAKVIGSDGSGAEAIFDTIVSTRALCGVPHPEETSKMLFKLLKPGGTLVVCEHIRNEWPEGGYWLGMVMQNFYRLAGWNVFMGGCQIDRETKKYLVAAGGKDGWKEINLTDIDAWSANPFVIGSLVKA